MWIVFDGRSGRPGAINSEHLESITVQAKMIDKPAFANALEALRQAVAGDGDMEDILSNTNLEVSGVFQVAAHPTTNGMYVLFEGTEAECVAVHRWIMGKIDYRVDVLDMADCPNSGAGETKPMEEAAPEPDEIPF